MRIYDRWGIEVFETMDPEEPWLGNFQGGDHYCQDGVYLYQIRVELAGGPILLEGHVQLLR
jgi:hypothetical protein